MADVEVKGLTELLAAMKKLPGIIQQKCLRRAMVPGAQKIRDAARSGAREKTGLLKQAIRIAYNRQESTPSRAVYHVFVSMRVRKVGAAYAMGGRAIKKLKAKGNQGSVSGAAYYWRFIEFGTTKMSAKPFMRPAFDSTGGQAVETIKNKLAELIEKEAATLGR
jgi:HK97 gp10 family phage protein